MKKAYLKKEMKKLYVETVAKAAAIVIAAEPEKDEDADYITEALKDIACQKSTNNDLYDALCKEIPSLEEMISKEDFTSLMQLKIKETLDKLHY